jgi:nucleoside-diphosphate-sugar epimerase
MEVAILRPPLVYGPGVKANFLRLMKLVNRGVPLPLKSIENRRSLLYVGNLASAIMTCIDHPGAAGKVFLVSDGEDVSTPELFSWIASALGRSVYLLPFPPLLLRMAGRLTGSLSALEPLLDSLTVDSSKIRRVLNWRPPYTISEGFRDTASWFKSREPNS